MLDLIGVIESWADSRYTLSGIGEEAVKQICFLIKDGLTYYG